MLLSWLAKQDQIWHSPTITANVCDYYMYKDDGTQKSKQIGINEGECFSNQLWFIKLSHDDLLCTRRCAGKISLLFTNQCFLHLWRAISLLLGQNSFSLPTPSSHPVHLYSAHTWHEKKQWPTKQMRNQHTILPDQSIKINQ